MKIILKTKIILFIIIFSICNIYAITTSTRSVTNSNNNNLINFNVYVSTDTITIGDRFKLFVSIKHSPDIIITHIDPVNSISSFEIKDYELIGPKKTGIFTKNIIKKFTYILSTFTIGKYSISPITIFYKDINGNEYTKVSQEIIIDVLSVNKEDFTDIIDIKGQIRAKYPLWVYLIIISCILLIISGILGYYLYKANKLKKIIGMKEESKEPAHIIALRELNNLKTIYEDNKIDIKRYYVFLSEIIRTYLENRYNVDILDKTTYEIYHSMKNTDIEKKFLQVIKEFLEECDLVKFAKYIPNTKTTEIDYNTALDIIAKTKIVEIYDDLIQERSKP